MLVALDFGCPLVHVLEEIGCQVIDVGLSAGFEVLGDGGDGGGGQDASRAHIHVKVGSGRGGSFPHLWADRAEEGQEEVQAPSGL